MRLVVREPKNPPADFHQRADRELQPQACGLLLSSSLQWPEVLLHQLMCHVLAQNLAFNDRVVIVESGIDPRDLDFVHQVSGAGEIVRRVSDQAIDGKRDVRSPEVSRENRRNHTCHEAVRGRILWVIGSIC